MRETPFVVVGYTMGYTKPDNSVGRMGLEPMTDGL